MTGNHPAALELRLRWAAAVVLFGLVTWAYLPVLSAEFISFDDNDYVYDNDVVRQGLTLHGVVWAFTSTHAANYHPLTWISHMLDVQLFGLDAGAHHAVNVLLHLLNAALLLLVVARYGGWFWGALVVAALFALHPLRVQSVAWVAERKDLLCALFFLLCLAAWRDWVLRPGRLRLALVCVLLALGLLAKPMLVTLPCVLLLLDVWPLGRLQGQSVFSGRMLRLLLEKLPLFALAGGSVLLTLLAQGGGGAVSTLQQLPLYYRLANAVTAYWMYIWKTLWPTGLGLFYPLRPTSEILALAAAVGLVLVSLALYLPRKRAPYGLMGWLWYLGILLPVIGLVQVGGQAWADRYSYIPLIGLLWGAVWAGRDIWTRLPAPERLKAWGAVGLVLALCLPLAWGTRTQAGYWKDSETIYRQTLAHTEHNYLIHFNLAVEYRKQGRFQEAIRHYEASLEADASYHSAMNNLAFLLATAPDPALRDGERAVRLARRALELGGRSHPGLLDTLAVALAETGRLDEALSTARRAAAIAEHVGMHDVAAEIRGRIPLFQEGRALRIE